MNEGLGKEFISRPSPLDLLLLPVSGRMSPPRRHQQQEEKQPELGPVVNNP